MTGDPPPIDPGETLLRIVPPRWAEPGLDSQAFMPRQDETDGLSLYRLSLLPGLSSVLLAIRNAKTRHKLYVVRLPATAWIDLGLAVRPSPDRAMVADRPELDWLARSHCDVPQMGWPAVDPGGVKLAEIQGFAELLGVAGRDCVVGPNLCTKAGDPILP